MANDTEAAAFNETSSTSTPNTTTVTQTNLLDLADELLVNICLEICKQSQPLEPIRTKNPFNKFILSGNENTKYPSLLTGIYLAMTCKHLRGIVMDDMLFYRHNTFAFRDPIEMLAYLANITGDKRRAIRSIKFAKPSIIPYHYERAVTVMFSACNSLKHLEIHLGVIEPWYPQPQLLQLLPEKQPYRDRCINAIKKIRGLESFTLTCDDAAKELYLFGGYVLGTTRTWKELDNMIAKDTTLITRHVTRPRTINVTLGVLYKTLIRSGLNLSGTTLEAEVLLSLEKSVKRKRCAIVSQRRNFVRIVKLKTV